MSQDVEFLISVKMADFVVPFMKNVSGALRVKDSVKAESLKNRKIIII